MSEKNLDSKGRFRSRTIAFRLSPEEEEELNMRYRISGYQIKQDFIRDSLFEQKVMAKGNPQMLVSTKRYLKRIEILLREQPTTTEIGEIKVILERILEVVEGF